MISIIHYISASRRLEESKKTVMMLGGEREAPEMERAQRDMIALEKEYYGERVANVLFYSGMASFISFVVYIFYDVATRG
jgi:hypothetical protein